MPKRCEIIRNGEPCEALAEDGTCLFPPEERVVKCPARETVSREEKDSWMDEV
jgi:hypothetical protein